MPISEATPPSLGSWQTQPARSPATALSAAQTEIWLGQSLAPYSAVYTIGERATLPADLDIARFEQALRATVEETDALHVQIVSGETTPSQILGITRHWRLEGERNTALSQPDIDAVIEDALREGVSLAGGALFRVFLFRRQDGAWEYCQLFHHIAMDGLSGALFGARLAGCNACSRRSDRPASVRHLRFALERR
jgi:Condensation domain